MQLSEFTPELAEKLGAKKFVIQKTGSPEWFRCFVIRPDGCTIARLSFHNGFYHCAKWYKNKLIGGDIELDASDEIEMKFVWYYYTETFLEDETYRSLIKEAEKFAMTNYLHKISERNKLPKVNANGKRIKRKSIQKPSTRNALINIFRTNLHEYLRPR